MATRVDPYASYNFMVELDGITRAGFKDCSGLDTSQDAGTYREGTDKYLVQRKLPGLVSYSDVTLTRGVTSDRKLWDWKQKATDGTVERHDISITLLDDTGQPKITWNLFECWPTKWTGPSLDATADEIAIETLELTYERMALDSWK